MFKEGDVVKCISNVLVSDHLDVGATYVITAVSRTRNFVNVTGKIRNAGFKAERFEAIIEAPVPNKEFAVGDKVVCIEAQRPLVRRAIYTVRKLANNAVYLDDLPGRGWALRRFQLANGAAPIPVAPTPEPKPIRDGDLVEYYKKDPDLDSEVHEEYFGRLGKVGYSYGSAWYIPNIGYIKKGCLRHPAADYKAPLDLVYTGNLRAELAEKKAKGNASHRITSFAYLRNGRARFHIDPACYAPLNNLGGNPISGFAISTVGHRALNKGADKEKICKQYIGWLINDSPWASCFLTKDVEDAWQNGVDMDCNKPLSWLVGAGTALREATEYYANLPAFGWAIDQGYHGNVAYLLGWCCRQVNEGVWAPAAFAGGHTVLTGTMCDKQLFKFFATGVFRDLSLKPANVQTEGFTINDSIAKTHAAFTIKQWVDKHFKGEKVGEGFHATTKLTDKAVHEFATLINKTIKEAK